jgi:hypothetical protein
MLFICEIFAGGLLSGLQVVSPSGKFGLPAFTQQDFSTNQALQTTKSM